MVSDKREDRSSFVAAVKSGEPFATWISQNLPLLFLVPVSLWLAADQGNLAYTAATWFVGGSAFNLWWLPHLRRNRHPPPGSSQSIATATSGVGIFLTPEIGLVLIGFILMGVALGLASSLRRHPFFQVACTLVAGYSMINTDALSNRSWVIFAILIVPMAYSAVSFAAAELGHRERLLDLALKTSGGTAWDTNADGVIQSSLGVGIPGVGVGTRLSDVIHQDDHRPRRPEPGATLEYRVRAEGDDWKWIRESVEASTSSRDERRSGVTDITSEQESIALDQKRANLDQLTGQPNRSQHIRTAQEWTESKTGWMVLVDLDEFKQINDTFGHTIGDQVLREVAARLVRVDGNAHVARLGGDEFACLVDGEVEQAMGVADQLIEELVKPFAIESMSIYSGASVGLARFGEGVHANEGRRRAGVALREAKSTGNTAIQYSERLEQQSALMKALAVDLPSALVDGGIVVHYQPKLDLLTKQVVGYEALARWQHPEHGLLTPDAFLDLITVGGLHRQLYQTVLEQSLAALVSLQDGKPSLTMSVNVHARNLREPDLVDRTLAMLELFDLSPEDLILELTEHALIGEDQLVAQILAEFDDAGVGLSIDDFGSGFSSLSYLNRMPVCEVKLDRALVSQVTESIRAQAVAETVLWLASRLQLEVVAEGIEDLDTFDYLLKQGCSQGQGHLIGHPKSLAHWSEHSRRGETERVEIWGNALAE